MEQNNDNTEMDDLELTSSQAVESVDNSSATNVEDGLPEPVYESILQESFLGYEQSNYIEHDISYLEDEYRTLSEILGDSEELREVFHDRRAMPSDNGSFPESYSTPVYQAETESGLTSEVEENTRAGIEFDERGNELNSTADNTTPELGLAGSVQANELFSTSRDRAQGRNVRGAGNGSNSRAIIILFFIICIALYSYDSNRKLSADIASFNNKLSQSDDVIDRLLSEAKRLQRLDGKVALIEGSVNKESSKIRRLNDELATLSEDIRVLKLDRVSAQSPVPASTTNTDVNVSDESNQEVLLLLQQRLDELQILVNKNYHEIEKARTAAVTGSASAIENSLQGGSEVLWSVNLFSAVSKEDALEGLKEELKQFNLKPDIVRIERNGADWYRSRILGFASLKSAKQYTLHLKQAFGIDAWVSREEVSE